MRLWVRLTLAMAIVSLLPVVVTGLLALRTATSSAERTSQRNQELSAKIQADFVSIWVRSQTGFLAGWRDVYAGRLATLEPRLQTGFLQQVLLSTRSVVTIALVDAQGRPVVEPIWLAERSPGEVGPGRAETMIRLAPLEALSAQRPVALGDLYVPAAGSPVSVPVAVLATSGDDGEGLAIVAELSLGQVVSTLDRESGPERGMALLDAEGAPRYGAEHPLVRPDLIRPLAGTDSRFDYAPADGVAVHGETAPVEGTGWTVVVVEPSAVVFAAVDSIRRTLQLTVAGAILLALALGVGVAQGVAAPLARLRDSVLAVAQGQVGQQVPTSGGGELTELARAFNHMSSELARAEADVLEKQQRIEAFNRELQDRVEARTAELREAQGELVRSGQLAAVAEVGAGLAHELNNPLAGILGLAQVLRTRHREGLDASLLGDIEEQAQRCREVVEAMQRFADPDVDLGSGGVIDLSVVLDEVEALVSGPFRQRGVHLEVAPASGALPVRLDRVQGTRILAQILQALRAGLPEGSTLTLQPERTPAAVVVTMRADRVDDSLSRQDDRRAAGLGLWVARQVVARHGGRLESGERTWRLELPVGA